MFDPQVAAVMDKVNALREQVKDHWQIPRPEALALAQIVRIGRCRSICEIGTSYGFSALHLGAAVKENGGHMHTFDIDPRKVQEATKHLREAGLLDVVTLHQGDARQLVKEFTPAQPYDFAFIDATKDESFDYLDALFPKLAARAILATDNITTHAKELAPFVERLRQLSHGKTCPVAVGNGFELTLVERKKHE